MSVMHFVSSSEQMFAWLLLRVTFTQFVVSKCHLFVSVIAVDGEKLVMKGAKLTTREMLDAFRSRCTAKELQTPAAAKK